MLADRRPARPPSARVRPIAERPDRHSNKMAPKKTIVKKTKAKAAAPPKASGGGGGTVKIEACKS